MASVSKTINKAQPKRLVVPFSITQISLALCLLLISVGGGFYLFQKFLTTFNTEINGMGSGYDHTALFSWFSAQPETIIILVGFCIVLFLLMLAPHIYLRPLKRLTQDISQFTAGNWEHSSSNQYRYEFNAIAYSFNQLANEVKQLSRRVDSQASDHDDKIAGLSKISLIALKSPSVEELIRPILVLSLKHFGYQYAALYFLSREMDNTYAAVLRQGVGEPMIEKTFIQKSITLDTVNEAENAIAKAFAAKQPVYAYRHDPNSINPSQADLFHELAFPIMINQKVIACFAIGALSARQEMPTNTHGEVTSSPSRVMVIGSDQAMPPRVSITSDNKLAELQIIANQISLALRSFHSEGLSSTVFNTNEQTPTSQIYQAGAQIAQSENLENLLSRTSSLMKDLPHSSVLLLAEGDEIQIVQRWPGKNENTGRIIRQLPGKNILPVSLRTISTYFKLSSPIIVNDIRSSSLPKPLLDIPRQMGCDTVAFLPILRDGKIATMLILGHARDLKDPSGKKIYLQGVFTPDYLQPYNYLLETITSTIDKLKAQEDIRKRLAEVLTLWNISQTISVENNLQDIYQVIHNQVEKAIGKLSTFAVLLYDEQSGMIQVQYIVEEGKNLEINPFPLGEGLTSIVMHTGKPLLITENIEKIVKELGAKIVGAIPKSWLGVPLKYAGETFGVIISQDNFRENRFSEEDQRLLSMIASQVALVIRNVRLLESSKTQAKMERILNQITGKIRRAMDMESILQTTVNELALALNAQKASIKIELTPSNGNNGKPSAKRDLSKYPDTK